MKIVCPNCQSHDVRPDVRSRNPTGETRDHEVRIRVVCGACGVVTDVTDQVAQAEAEGDEVMVGVHRLRRARR